MIKAIKDSNDIITDYGNHLKEWNCEVPEVPLTFGEHKVKYVDGRAVLFEDVDEIRELYKKELRAKCREEREKYFPDSVKDNLLIGIKYSDEKISVSNYKKLAEHYIYLVHSAETLLDNAVTSKDIIKIIDSIDFPDGDEILNADI